MGTFKLTDSYLAEYNRKRSGGAPDGDANATPRNKKFDDVDRMLRGFGFRRVRKEGSHWVFKHPGARYNQAIAEEMGMADKFLAVTVPEHDTLRTGTLGAILRSATFIARCVPGNEGITEADLRRRL